MLFGADNYTDSLILCCHDVGPMSCIWHLVLTFNLISAIASVLTRLPLLILGAMTLHGFIVSVFEKACSARWRVRVQNPPHSVSLSVPVHNRSLILRRSLRGIYEVMTI